MQTEAGQRLLLAQPAHADEVHRDVVAPHETDRAHVAGPHRHKDVGDLVAQRADLLFPVHQWQQVEPDARGLIVQPLQHLACRLVADDVIELLLVGDVNAGELVEVGLLGHALGALEQRFELAGVVPGGRSWRQLVHVLDEHHAQQVDVAQGLEVEGGDHGMGALSAFGQALGLETLQHAPDGGAADPILLGKLGLAQLRAGRVVQVGDAVTQVLVDRIDALLRRTGPTWSARRLRRAVHGCVLSSGG